jgi:hypothetical protein
MNVFQQREIVQLADLFSNFEKKWKCFVWLSAQTSQMFDLLSFGCLAWTSEICFNIGNS